MERAMRQKYAKSGLPQNRFPKIDLVKNHYKNQFPKFDFQKSISSNRLATKIILAWPRSQFSPSLRGRGGKDEWNLFSACMKFP